MVYLFDDVFAFSQKDGFKFAVLTDPFFLRAALFFFVWREKITESVSLEKQRKRLPPFILKTRFARPRDAQIASSIIRF